MKGFGIYVKNNLLEPKHVEQMESSVWLYLWLLDKMTSVNENGVGKVLGNQPITHELVFADLGVQIRTYRRWVDTLRSYGYISTLRTPRGLCITINKAEKIFNKRGAKSAHHDVPTKSHQKHSDVPKTESDVPNNALDVPNPHIQYKTIQDNTIDNTSKTLANKSPEHEMVSKLYYQTIKAHGLPVMNHNTVKSKIKQMTTEVEYDKLVAYLEFMRDIYPTLELEYKPHINTALDIYNKRMQIANAIQSASKQQTKDQSRTLHL